MKRVRHALHFTLRADSIMSRVIITIILVTLISTLGRKISTKSNDQHEPMPSFFQRLAKLYHTAHTAAFFQLGSSVREFLRCL